MVTQSDHQRSRIMAGVRRTNTRPEIAVRSLLHRNGFRFRLHRRDLPGTPDIVLPRYRTAIFVHGCFWHRHPDCRKATVPASNKEFWLQKFANNVARDGKAIIRLRTMGWRVLVVWECEVSDPQRMRAYLRLLKQSPRVE